MELYKKYRPKTLKQVVGQPEIVEKLSGMIENKTIPHAILFTGPSGCGKTTLARILVNHLECGEHDYNEVNCADFRGIDMVREIRSCMNQLPISGKTRVWVIDECHKLSNDAQNAFLKLLEDTPNHVYFMLATTDDRKLIKTIITRCTKLEVKAIPEKSLTNLLSIVVKKESLNVSDAVIERILECSDSSARLALVILDQIRNLKSEESMLKAVPSIRDAEVEGFALIKALIYNPKTSWSAVTDILKNLEAQEGKVDVEGMRRFILACAKTELLKKSSGRAYNVIKAFEHPFFDSEWSGFVAACYEIVVPE